MKSYKLITPGNYNAAKNRLSLRVKQESFNLLTPFG